MKQKFIALRLDDIRKYCTPEQTNHFRAMLGRIAQGKQAAKEAEDILFVLNAHDEFAVGALEHYSNAIRQDAFAFGDQGCEQAATAAMNARDAGIMSGIQRKPRAVT